MLAIYACTLLIVLASLAIGRAILVALGGPRPAWLSGATGFAALVVIAPLLLRLPGRATTALIVAAFVTAVCGWVAVRDLRASSAPPTDLSGQFGRHAAGDVNWVEGLITAAVVAVIAAIPFAIAGRTGVLGEGIYTNDHAAQLYWADWLQRGFGPEPSAVRFGYPTGPQSVAVLAAQATGTSLVSAFNGLLLAIPVLTALTALGGLAKLRAVGRVATAVVVGLPYLGASFLAQSAFKETAMALFILAFALAMATRSGLAAPANDGGVEAGARTPRWRLLIGVGIILALATVFTFSVPGLAWFAIALPLWLIVEAVAGSSPIDWAAVRTAISEHKVLIGVVVLVLVGAAAVAFSPAREFANKIADVQESAGRLSSPVFPGEALGIWPAGDFRLVRGEVPGSLLAVAIGAVAVAYGMWFCFRRRQFALLSMLVTGGIVYIGTRLFAQIHVQAKALMVIAPLVLLVALAALLERAPGSRSWLRYGFGALVLVAALLSTLLALRAAPIGFDDRQTRARAARRGGRRAHARLPRRRPLLRLLPARHPDARAGRIRAPGDQGTAREDVAAGARGGLRHARGGPARQVPVRDHDRRGVCLDAARELRAGRLARRLRALEAQRRDAAQPRAEGRGQGRQDLRLRPGGVSDLRRPAEGSLGHGGRAPPAGGGVVRQLGHAAAAEAHRGRAGPRLGGARDRDEQAVAARNGAATTSRFSTTRRCRSTSSTTAMWSRRCRRRSTACT